MNYPLISEYIEAIKSSEDNFEELKNLRPVLNEDGEPVMSGGNFAVVFKMKDEQTGKLHAVKCFLKEQEGRADAYHMIAEELEYVSSTFLTPIKYLDKELFVDSNASEETEFPVLLMDWVEGITLEKYIREHIDDEYELALLAYQFSRLAMWLMPQPFAHGDLKPDNILVRDDGTLVLVDYDGMYVPAMKGQKARELGSPDFRHPSRTEEDFNEHIDDFSLVSILLSLKSIALLPELLDQYGASDRLLLSERDYLDVSQSDFLHLFFPIDDKELNRLYSLFLLCLVDGSLPFVLSKSLNILRPNKTEYNNIPILLKLANSNNVISQYKLGICYLDGKGVGIDYNESLKWLKKAAEFGHAKALEALGMCYYFGKGVDKDYNKALDFLYKAEPNYKKENLCYLMERIALTLEELGDHQNMLSILKEFVRPGKGCTRCSIQHYNTRERCCPWMQYKVGRCYDDGVGVESNSAKAVEWYSKSAEQGYSYGQYMLGLCYYLGHGVEKDHAKAVEWYSKSAEQGNSNGQWRLGLCYYFGYGVEKDDAKAVEWYAKSAEQGNSVGQYRLGACYYFGHGVKKDHKKAVEWYSKSAEQGNSEGQWRLGLCYSSGKGVEMNFAIAAELYAKSAEQGNPEGQWRLGLCYYIGDGVKKNYEKAVEWYAKSAEQGNSVGQYRLGLCYCFGHGVEKDYAKTVEWYAKSAEQGNPEGQWRLGLCYSFGIGVEKNFAKAAEWYAKSAEQGNSSGQYQLGLCYSSGKGIEKNPEKTLYWLKKAVEQGNIKAKEELEKLSKTAP